MGEEGGGRARIEVGGGRAVWIFDGMGDFNFNS